MGLHLAGNIDPALWAAVATSYEAGSYSNSVTDSIHYLTDVLREKIESDADGVQLVGQALEGDSPQIRLNKLQTETDRNEQRGFASILRGVYQGIRNPRSHQQYSDTKESADAIIVFIDFLIKTVQSAPDRFQLANWIYQVFDRNFVRSNDYEKLLANEVPNRYLVEAMRELFIRRSEEAAENISLVMSALVERLNESKKREYAALVSQALRTIPEEETRIAIQVTPTGLWPYVDKVPKIRIENILIKDMRQGKVEYDKKNQKYQCLGGALATWGREFWHHFELKNDLVRAILFCLGDGVSSRMYINQFYVYEAINLLYSADEFKESRWFFCLYIRNSISKDECIFDELLKRESTKESAFAAFHKELIAFLEPLRHWTNNSIYWNKVYPFTDEAKQELDLLFETAQSLKEQFGTLDDSCICQPFIEWDFNCVPLEDEFDLDIDKWSNAMIHIIETSSELVDSFDNDILV